MPNRCFQERRCAWHVQPNLENEPEAGTENGVTAHGCNHAQPTLWVCAAGAHSAGNEAGTENEPGGGLLRWRRIPSWLGDNDQSTVSWHCFSSFVWWRVRSMQMLLLSPSANMNMESPGSRVQGYMMFKAPFTINSQHCKKFIVFSERMVRLLFTWSSLAKTFIVTTWQHQMLRNKIFIWWSMNWGAWRLASTDFAATSQTNKSVVPRAIFGATAYTIPFLCSLDTWFWHMGRLDACAKATHLLWLRCQAHYSDTSGSRELTCSCTCTYYYKIYNSWYRGVVVCIASCIMRCVVCCLYVYVCCMHTMLCAM